MPLSILLEHFLDIEALSRFSCPPTSTPQKIPALFLKKKIMFCHGSKNSVSFLPGGQRHFVCLFQVALYLEKIRVKYHDLFIHYGHKEKHSGAHK